MEDSRFTPFEVMYAAAELEANRQWPLQADPDLPGVLQERKWSFRCLISAFDRDSRGLALLRSPIGDPMSALPAAALLLEGLDPYSVVIAFESPGEAKWWRKGQRAIPALGRWAETIPLVVNGARVPDGVEQNVVVLYASKTAMQFWTIPFVCLKDHAAFGEPSGPGDLAGNPRTPLLTHLDRLLHPRGPTMSQMIDEVSANVGPSLSGMGEQIKLEETLGVAVRYGYEILDNENFRYRSLEAVEAQANRN